MAEQVKAEAEAAQAEATEAEATEAEATQAEATGEAQPAEGTQPSEEASPARERGLRKVRQGVVVSTKMAKTITVECVYQKQHPKYGKYVKRYTKFKAHDEEEKAGEGDIVEIKETRPLSKTKRYRLLRIVRSAKR
ncbi:30S ribosomal protein S17 [Planctomycetota bacterium]